MRKNREDDKVYYQNNKEIFRRLQHKRRMQIYEWYYSNISYLCCADCGYSFKILPQVAEFHHEQRNGKHEHISPATQSYSKFCAEAEKGIFLCPTCHRIRHITNQ